VLPSRVPSNVFKSILYPCSECSFSQVRDHDMQVPSIKIVTLSTQSNLAKRMKQMNQCRAPAWYRFNHHSSIPVLNLCPNYLLHKLCFGQSPIIQSFVFWLCRVFVPAKWPRLHFQHHPLHSSVLSQVYGTAPVTRRAFDVLRVAMSCL